MRIPRAEGLIETIWLVERLTIRDLGSVAAIMEHELAVRPDSSRGPSDGCPDRFMGRLGALEDLDITPRKPESLDQQVGHGIRVVLGAAERAGPGAVRQAELGAFVDSNDDRVSLARASPIEAAESQRAAQTRLNQRLAICPLLRPSVGTSSHCPPTTGITGPGSDGAPQPGGGSPGDRNPANFV